MSSNRDNTVGSRERGWTRGAGGCLFDYLMCGVVLTLQSRKKFPIKRTISKTLKIKKKDYSMVWSCSSSG